jgi:hypothetical protein
MVKSGKPKHPGNKNEQAIKKRSCESVGIRKPPRAKLGLKTKQATTKSPKTNPAFITTKANHTKSANAAKRTKTTQTKTKKNTKGTDVPDSPTFLELVAKYQARLLEEEAKIPLLEDEKRRLQTEISNLRAFPKENIRAILERQQDIVKLVKKISILECRKAYISFSERVVPLVQRYREAMSHVGNNISVLEPIVYRKTTQYLRACEGGRDDEGDQVEDEPAHEDLIFEVASQTDEYNYDDELEEYGEYGDGDYLPSQKRNGNHYAGYVRPAQAEYLYPLESQIEEDFIRRLQRMVEPDSVLPFFIQRDECPRCHVEMLKMQSTAQLVCPKCQRCTKLISSTTEALAFGEEVDMSDHMYKRVEYYAKYLKQYRMDAEMVPPEVIEKVDAHIRKFHDIAKDKITAALVRTILKKVDLRSYDSMAASICNGLLGNPIARLSEFQYSRLVWRFKQEQGPYELVKAKGRSNFMSFKYSTNKNLRMDGWSSLCLSFPLPTTPGVVKKLDSTKKKVCEILQSRRKHASDPPWMFYPSE